MSEPTTRDVTNQLLVLQDNLSNVGESLFSGYVNAAIAKLRKLAEIEGLASAYAVQPYYLLTNENLGRKVRELLDVPYEDARPEQPEANVAYVRVCDQPEAKEADTRSWEARLRDYAEALDRKITGDASQGPTLSVHGSQPIVIPEWARSVHVKSVTLGYETTTTIEIRGGDDTQ